MKIILMLITILLLNGCGGVLFGHKWSAEMVASIPNGTPRSEVLKKFGSPYYTTTKDYDRSNPNPNGYSDQWFHNGEELSGHRFQEQITVYYDNQLRVTDIKYTTSS